MKDAFAYVPELNMILRVAEGTGGNLLPEEVDEGYVDYVYYEIYEPEYGFPEVDGGMITKKELLVDTYGSMEEAIDEVIEFHYGCDLDYIVMKEVEEDEAA